MWPPTPTSTFAGPGENISVKGTLDSSPAALFKVQNVNVRFQAGSVQSQKGLKLLNWGALQPLMAAK